MQERLKRRVGGKGGEDEEGGIIDRLNRLRIILLISLQTIKDFYLPLGSFYFTFISRIALVYMCPYVSFNCEKLCVFSVVKLTE
jgi:hypothetical protein